MATLALSVAGQFVGGMVGGPIGATIGRALGGLAGNAIDQKIFGSGGTKAAPSDIRLTGAHEGTAIPRLWGWARVAGNIIWATDLQVLRSDSRGSKGGSNQQEDVIATSFALALCEGEISHIGRVWADGNLLDTQSLNMRVYTGSQTQNADPMIERVQNAKVPAYRGLAYIVFEQMPLNDFGKRIPNLTVEVCRAIGSLEPSIEAICITPGSTEFGYDPKPLVRIVGFGASQTENAHMYGGRSDWEVSLDQLQAMCPNLKHVSLVVSWFGTDLNCADCKIEPRVENHAKLVRARNGLPVLWQVDGVNRILAHSVSAHNGASAYGGSPNDASVIAAIKDLRTRGLKVTLNPFISMDIEVGNQLINPQTGALGQGAYPWRGRIMPSNFSGLSVSAQVAAFVGNGYRQMILHYARLSRTAGGVDAMLIGSEMRGMTAARDGSGRFPFVAALKTLAAEVRAIVGTQTKLTYGADWSEYWGMKPEGDGDICYHLDPLWADENIDAIGIDNYLPITDAHDIYDISVLRAGIHSGEHHDYFYANASDRLNGIRTPISDGAYGESWVWRAKDLVSWWSNPHHDRIGGIKSSEPSPWVPKSKPIWFTELGCGAVDRGSDAPNAFGDPKSIENALPHGSTGAQDPLIQRQFLKAHFNHWADEQANPLSPLYQGTMVDVTRLYIWNWDARPFPAFPAQQDIWADAENYQTGHWLNGRLGQADAADLIVAMAADFKVPVSQVDIVVPLISGLVIEAQTSMRDAIAAVLEMTNLRVVAGVDGLRFTRPGTDNAISISADDLVANESNNWSIRRQDYAELIGDVSVNFYDMGQDYQVSAVSVQSGDVTVSHHVQGGLVLDEANALLGAEIALHTLSQGQHIYSFSLPPSYRLLNLLMKSKSLREIMRMGLLLIV